MKNLPVDGRNVKEFVDIFFVLFVAFCFVILEESQFSFVFLN